MGILKKIIDRAKLSSKIVKGDVARVQVVYWSRKGNENFGDYLSKIIYDHILGHLCENRMQENFSAAEFMETPKRLLSIGSIMHLARENDVIWGTGVNGKISPYRYNFNNLDIRMVRGPLTRKLLLRSDCSCPEVYGDPGLLLPLFLPIDVVSNKHEYTIIPNLNDMWTFDESNSHLVSPLSGWKKIVQRICESELVIASSLHGLIIADAYKIPARLLLSYHEPLFKYKDYLLSTNRGNAQIARTVEEAREMGGMPLPIIDFKTMIDAFPADLWNRKLDAEQILNSA